MPEKLTALQTAKLHLKSPCPDQPNPDAPVFLGGETRPDGRFHQLYELTGVSPERDIESGGEACLVSFWVLPSDHMKMRKHWSDRLHGCIDSAVLCEPSYVATLSVLLDVTKKLDSLRFVAGLSGVINWHDHFNLNRYDVLVRLNQFCPFDSLSSYSHY